MQVISFNAGGVLPTSSKQIEDLFAPYRKFKGNLADAICLNI
jgi:hypothetical protein